MDERKYPAIGTATISVEKYEDLIRTAETEKRNAEVNKEKYWTLFNVVTKFEKKIEAQTEAVKSVVETVAGLSNTVNALWDLVMALTEVGEE